MKRSLATILITLILASSASAHSVNVNTATPADLASLSLSASDAASLLRHRRMVGGYRRLSDLEAVLGRSLADTAPHIIFYGPTTPN